MISLMEMLERFMAVRKTDHLTCLSSALSTSAQWAWRLKRSWWESSHICHWDERTGKKKMKKWMSRLRSTDPTNISRGGPMKTLARGAKGWWACTMAWSRTMTPGPQGDAGPWERAGSSQGCLISQGVSFAPVADCISCEQWQGNRWTI